MPIIHYVKFMQPPGPRVYSEVIGVLVGLPDASSQLI